MTAEQVCDLFDAIESERAGPGEIIALRDRALIGMMLRTFARVSAALQLNVGDHVQSGKRSMALRRLLDLDHYPKCRSERKDSADQGEDGDPSGDR